MLALANLEEVRSLMLEEFDADLAKGVLYQCPRLTESGLMAYPALLRRAIAEFDEDWLASEIRRLGLMKSKEQRRTKSGTILATVPYTAPDTLAEGEFNRYYIRGVCRSAIDTHLNGVTIYRAKEVGSPRPESERRRGTKIDATALLADLRQSTMTVDAALKMPPGPNSGMSVRLL